MDFYVNACKDIPADILAEIEYRRDHPSQSFTYTSLIWTTLTSYLRPRRLTSAQQIEELGRLWSTTLNAAMGVSCDLPPKM
jgi:hypothetical protein